MLLRDYSWVVERSGSSSFLGIAALAMVYPLAESIFYFGLLLALGLLIPWKWPAERVYAVLGFTAIWIPITKSRH